MMADPFVMLAIPHKPKYWWYEVFSLGRRFMLTSVVLAFNRKESFTVYVVLVLVLVHVAEREWSPPIDPFMGILSYGLSWQIVMSVIYMLFLDAKVLEGTGAIWMSCGLLIFNISIFGLIWITAFANITEQQEKDKKLELLHHQILVDKQEDKEKFGDAWTNLIETGGLGDEARLLNSLKQLASLTELPSGKQPSPVHGHKFRPAPLATVDALLADAEEVAPRFHAILKALVLQFGGEYLAGPNKSRARAIEKIENDYSGNHLKLVDVVRASGIFATFSQLALMVEALMGAGCSLLVVRAKDRFNNPTDFGYKDLLLNVKLDDSDHIGELQLHLQAIIDIKPACHRTYALMRAVGWEDDSLSDEEDDGEEPQESAGGEGGAEMVTIKHDIKHERISANNPMLELASGAASGATANSTMGHKASVESIQVMGQSTESLSVTGSGAADRSAEEAIELGDIVGIVNVVEEGSDDEEKGEGERARGAAAGSTGSRGPVWSANKPARRSTINVLAAAEGSDRSAQQGAQTEQKALVKKSSSFGRRFSLL